jgi:hypothetical protein
MCQITVTTGSAAQVAQAVVPRTRDIKALGHKTTVRYSRREHREARDLRKRKWSHCRTIALSDLRQCDRATVHVISYVYIATLLSVVTKGPLVFRRQHLMTIRTPSSLRIAIHLPACPLLLRLVSPLSKRTLGSYPVGAIHNNHMTPQLTDDVIPVQSVKLAQEVELPLAVGQERMYRRLEDLDGNKQGFPCKLDTVLFDTSSQCLLEACNGSPRVYPTDGCCGYNLTIRVLGDL